ncbi:DUF418 domain-containing protein [Fredinandcohnia quinoae]|uniref:Heparan-alpha-glucosaminide N-acetyltransferase domain-containing protein n=1 Tax=Fredinandcohnia quinoae TaxID=2918902 RepID=A0AAW5DXE2_9BACI|nr:heparan-alpha-glucosaminide N-acetyltransferase domain-containing protein [Fredinandcohnia sp. SECRCQ15]MCH1625321.1 heparan-alpha-glucosaminide N-acetyltransferase domain-containing protein [Fredinandcohnia sp. SECRCQ15]
MTKHQITNGRIEGLDFARALALFGMFVVNYKVIVEAEGNGSEWLIWFTELFQGRASAVFVLLAGIGISLMTKKARNGDSNIIRISKKNIWKRSAFLFLLGMVLYVVGWTGDILHYYGVFMFIASFLIATSSKMIIIICSLFGLIAQIMQVTSNYLKGWNHDRPFIEYTDFWTIEGFMRNLLFNGYHPIFPWICFFLLGMIIGRLELTNKNLIKKMGNISFLLLLFFEITSRVLLQSSLKILDLESASYLFQTGPIPPNLFYLTSNASSAVLIVVISINVTRKFSGNWLVKALINTGQLSLTHYVSHVFVGIGILVLLGRLVNQTLELSLIFSTLFFVGSMLFSIIWRKKFKRGPIEWMMRKLVN